MSEWTEQATRQLDQSHDYIALSNSAEVTARITMQIVTSVQQLVVYPMSGRAGRVPGTRGLVISNTPFIVAYAIEKADIVVLAVYHAAQHWPEDYSVETLCTFLIESMEVTRAKCPRMRQKRHAGSSCVFSLRSTSWVLPCLRL
jgi:toxin ParE1/3/4